MSGLDPRLRHLLVCPSCRGELGEGDDALICPREGLRFPIRDGIPLLAVDFAERADRTAP